MTSVEPVCDAGRVASGRLVPAVMTHPAVAPTLPWRAGMTSRLLRVAAAT